MNAKKNGTNGMIVINLIKIIKKVKAKLNGK